jgi:protein-S-isoprenylcysteine O-methyltransferase Ste14
MLIRNRLTREGDFLFRWRSYAPLLLVPVVVVALPEQRDVAALLGHTVEHAMFYVAVLISFTGLAIRWVTVAFVPSGTSGRNTASQRAHQLNTTGMYSVVRNPLYLGNFIAILGVLLSIKVWWVIAIFLLCYWLYIERVIAVEEAYLEGKFGDQYREWVARVPAFVPNLAGWTPPSGAFSLTLLLRREYNGLLAVGASLFMLELLFDVFVQDQPIVQWLHEDLAWGVLGAATLALFLVLRWLKRQTRILDL